MNAYELAYRDPDELDLPIRDRQPARFQASSPRKTYSRQRGKAPQRFNGIHRRRAKKIRW